MRMIRGVPGMFALVVVAATLQLEGETVQAPKSIGQIVKAEARLDQLVAPGTSFEVIGTGFDWSEGPLWVKRDGGFLLFSDIPPNSIMKWTPGAAVSLFMKPAGYTGIAPYGKEPGSNGLTLDREGRLVLAEHGDRRIARMEWNGGKRTLADNYQGKRLNSPNDVIVKSNGDVYFTDPIYGFPDREKDTEHRELDFCGVFRWSPKTGEVTLLTKELSRPNGLAFSPDEKTLYVANSDPERAIWMAYPVSGDGTLGGGQGHTRRDQDGVEGTARPARRDESRREGHDFRHRAWRGARDAARWHLPRTSRHRPGHVELCLGRGRQRAVHHRRHVRAARQDAHEGRGLVRYSTRVGPAQRPGR